MHTYTERQIAILSEIIQFSYTDILSRKGWDEILRLLTTVISCDASAAIFFDADTGLPSWYVGSGMDETFFDQYKTKFHLLDPILTKGLAEGRYVWRPEDMMPRVEWMNTEMYKQLSGVYGVKNFVTIIVKYDTRAAIIVRLVRHNASSPFTDREVEILSVIQPHIAAAFERANRKDKEDFLVQTIIPSLDGTANPFFIFDHDGDLVRMNDVANEMYEATDDKQAMRDDLCRAASTLIWSEAQSGPGVDQLDAIFHVDTKKFRLSSFPIQPPGPRPWYILYASDMGFHLRERYETAMGAFGLSAREREICEMLIYGLSNRQIAEKTQLTELTVKDHVKSIREKLGVSSRNRILQTLLMTES